MKTRLIKTLLLICGLWLSGLVVQAQGPETPPSVAGGRALWPQNCAPCHGPTGLGDGPTAQAIQNPLPNFADPINARQMVPAESFEVIKNGRIDNMMPPWGNRLSDAEIWDLTAQVWQLGTNPADVTTGETLYAAQCVACHGEGGTGDGPAAPAEINDFTDLAAMVQVSQTDLLASYLTGEVHRQIELSEVETWQALAYIRTFSFAVPQRNGVLTGQATNGTSGQALVNVAITLRILDNNTELETFTAQTDSEGRYTFSALPTDPNLLYLVESSYEEVPYQSEQLASFGPDTTETRLDLKVYATTREAKAISITQLHYIVAFAPEAVNVLQIFVLGNAANQTYIGDESGQTFDFALPSVAQNPTFQGDIGGVRFVETGNGFADTQPIVPGEEGQVIAVTYDIPYDGDTITVESPIPAQAGSVSLLLEDRGAGLESEQLTFVENRDIQGSPFGLFGGADLAQGDTLTFRLNNLTGLSQPVAAPEGAIVVPVGGVDQTTLLWLIGAVGVLAVLGVGVVYPFTRSQTVVGQAEDDPEYLRQKFLLLLARLDAAFEVGEIEEGVYRQARAGYKRQLAALIEQYD
jgi:mono/diheme cytochrome c family protein